MTCLRRLCLTIAFGCLCTVATATSFVPMVRNYFPSDYLSSNQNWCVTQAPDGLIYVANTSGVLTFDGAGWTLTAMPDMRIVRSVKATDDGRIYVGSFEEIGYFERDSYGGLRYTSLVPLAGDAMKPNDEVWSIVECGGKLFFHSFSAIFCYDGQSVKSERFAENITAIAECGGRLYLNFQYRGLAEMNPDTFEYTLFNNSDLADAVTVLPYGSDRVVVTKNRGFFLMKEGRFERLGTLADKQFRRAEINRAIITADNKYVIGTISEGVVIVDSTGKICSVLNSESNTLANNTVLGLYSDAENNIWIALDNGISVYSPYLSLGKIIEFEPNVGTIYSTCDDGRNLYVASNQGLYRHSHQTGRTEKILAGQVWDLHQEGSQIFCSNSGVTQVIHRGAMSQCGERSGGVNIAKGYIAGREVMIQSSYSTLDLFLRDRNGLWRFSNEIGGFINPTRYIEIDYKGRVWCSHFRRGLYCLELNDELTGVAKSTFISSPDASNALFNVFKVDNQVVFANREMIYTYDDTSRRIVPFEMLNNVLGQFRTAYRIAPFGDNRYWFITPTDAALVLITSNQMKILDVVSYKAFDETYIDDQQNIVPVSETECYFCFENSIGLYRLDSLSPKPLFPVSIRSVKAVNGEGRVINMPIDRVVEIPYDYQTVELHYSLPSYSCKGRVTYRYWLDGAPLATTLDTQVKYSILRNGRHLFVVEALDEKGGVLSDDKYEFIIAQSRYLNFWAWLIYTLLFGGLVFGIVRYVQHLMVRRSLKIRAQEAELRRRKQEEQQQIILTLEKENLEKEINFKSKELASSTMSIIRKNEILQQIRSELTEQKSVLGAHYPTKYYDKIVKMIDQNISSDDDWSMFQHNFDRIHENFFVKLKERYANLTDADLRLCAFLHLNLSSKEIANLMNISIKGVEVARYRLRKKLDLPTGKSLTEFLILFK